jgi:DNA-binding MarR family transcriptional regulator
MGKRNRQERIEGLLKLAEQLFRELLPTVPRELLEMDITMPQLKTLLLLFLNGPTRMSKLASDLGVTLATTTGLIDRMVERGIVLRQSQPEDRRVVLCCLSDTGQMMVSRLWESSKNKSRELLESLDTAKLQAFSEVLEAMLKSSGQENTRTTVQNGIQK